MKTSAGILLLLALGSVAASRARAQAQASLGVGAATARYADGSTLSAAALAPALELSRPSLSFDLTGTLASLPLGVWSRQGRAALWAAEPGPPGTARLGVDGFGAGTSRSDGAWTATAGGVGELLWMGAGGGIAVGAGPTAGWVVNDATIVGLHARARGWRQSGATTWTASVEPTRFLGAWYTDVSAGLNVAARSVSVVAWGTARLSTTYGSKAGGGVLLRLFPAPHLAVELGGGTYLPDPFQGLPRASYLTAGIRVFSSGRSAPLAARAPRWPPLTLDRDGDSVVVRFLMPDARALSIAGDWNDWQPVALESAGGGRWQGALALASGTWHFNLVADGEWVVPAGVKIVTDRAGGMVAVLVVR